jgi:hypothetical protein
MAGAVSGQPRSYRCSRLSALEAVNEDGPVPSGEEYRQACRVLAVPHSDSAARELGNLYAISIGFAA